MKKKLLNTVLAACMLLSGCSAPAATVQEQADENTSGIITAGVKKLDFKNLDSKSYDEEAMRGHFMKFVFDLYAKTAEENDANVMLSPYSLMSALELAAAGADGDTLKQMLSLYGDPEDPEATIKYVSDLMEKFNSSGDVKLKVANAAWLQGKIKDSPAREEYIKTISDFLGSEINMRDFGNKEGLKKEINEWVDGKTDGKIPELIDELSPDCVAVLVNTILFEGKWAKEFSGSMRSEFHGKSGDKKTEFISGKAEVYLESSKGKGFAKYYDGGDFAFVALLPGDENVSMADFVKDLKPSEFEEFYKSGKEEVKVVMPSFESRFKVKAPEILQELGMTDAFDPAKADFGSIGEGLFIDDVIQETYIKVDKEGTEAAAASAVIMSKNAVSDRPEKIVKLDRPFVYAIVDRDSGTPVFIGHLQDI